MKQIRELLTDILVATGAAIGIFSIGLVILILVTAVPVGNPYIGIFTFIFMPALAILGGILFIFGVLLGKKKKT